MLNWIASQMAKMNAKNVNYIDISNSTNTKEINRQIIKDSSLTGQFSLSIPSDRVHAMRWAHYRETIAVETAISSTQKEIIAAGVSKSNECPYCEDVHKSSIDSNEIQHEFSEIYQWSLNTLNPNAHTIKNPPFIIQDAPEIIETALFYHSTNRLVTLFLDDSALPSLLANKYLKKNAMKLVSSILFRRMIKKEPGAGESLNLIKKYKLFSPSNLSRFEIIQATTNAQHQLTNIIEKERIPKHISQIFRRFVDEWTGEDLPLGRAWIHTISESIDKHERPLLILIFISAFAPHMLLKNDIESYRKMNNSDENLIETCYWSTQIISNRIKEWLIAPFHKLG